MVNAQCSLLVATKRRTLGVRCPDVVGGRSWAGGSDLLVQRRGRGIHGRRQGGRRRLAEARSSTPGDLTLVQSLVPMDVGIDGEDEDIGSSAGLRHR